MLTMKKDFKDPILSHMCSLAGCLNLVFTLMLVIFFANGGTSAGLSGSQGVVFSLGVGLSSALLMFGIGEFITYVARTAHHAQSMDESLQVEICQIRKALALIAEKVDAANQDQRNVPDPPPESESTWK